jgi:hypothetical protein
MHSLHVTTKGQQVTHDGKVTLFREAGHNRLAEAPRTLDMLEGRDVNWQIQMGFWGSTLHEHLL